MRYNISYNHYICIYVYVLKSPSIQPTRVRTKKSAVWVALLV